MWGLWNILRLITQTIGKLNAMIILRKSSILVIDTIIFQNSRERESSMLFNVVKITLYKEFMSDNCGQNNYYHFQ